MPDRQELLEKLKSLNSAQFKQVLFNLNIDPSIIPDDVSRTEKAITVISLIEQKPNGLQQLEDVLNKILYQGSNVPLPPPPINLKLLSGVGVALLIIGAFIGVRMFFQDPSPTPTTPPPTPGYRTKPLPTLSSSPCSEGYTFEGLGPGPSGEYSGWCNSTSSPGERYECVGRPGTQKCRKP